MGGRRRGGGERENESISFVFTSFSCRYHHCHYDVHRHHKQQQPPMSVEFITCVVAGLGHQIGWAFATHQQPSSHCRGGACRAAACMLLPTASHWIASAAALGACEVIIKGFLSRIWNAFDGARVIITSVVCRTTERSNASSCRWCPEGQPGARSTQRTRSPMAPCQAR